jgi:glucosamine--fructose-6-phosphate aminotransferase (isomerizing)
MCGIFGFAAEDRLTPGQVRLALGVMTQLALASEVRGKDAGGFAVLSANGELVWRRQAGPAGALFEAADWQRLRERRILLAIGHARYATHGAPAVNGNNHPHLAGDWALVHNGVIPYHHQKASHLRIKLRGQCDSEILAHVLARYGSKRGPGVCTQLCGSQSVLAISSMERAMLAWSNGRSPLVAFRVEEIPAVWWASTMDIVEEATFFMGLHLCPAVVKVGTLYRMEAR